MTKIDSNQSSVFFTGLKKRLAMMAKAKASGKPKDILKAASDLAQHNVDLKAKANNTKPQTAFEHGQQLAEILRQTGAIATDATGTTTEGVVKQAETNQGTIDEKKRKELTEKYGAPEPPSLPELLIHAVADLGDLKDVKLTRRELFRTPIEGLKQAVRESGPDLLPFPLNKVAKIFGIFKWWGNNSEKAQTTLQSSKT